MFILYNLIFLIIALIYLPVYLFKGKFHKGFLSRLGFLPRDLALKQPIWVHAVSVGEVMAVTGLIEGIRKTYPDKKLVISTVTLTGNEIARRIAQETDFVTYLPLDFSFIVNSAIERIKPSLVVIVETELWPNFISCLHNKNIPIVVVNARISDKSFKGYTIIKFLLKPILSKIDMFCAQTELDARRLIRLGVSQPRIRVTGNMKFDIKDYTSPFAKASGDSSSKPWRRRTDYRKFLGLNTEDKFLVAGSTHPGEEEIVLNVYKNLLKDYIDLRILIAPRRPERAKDIEKIVIKYGFNPLKVSQFPPEADQPLAEAGSPATPPEAGGAAKGGISQFNRQTVFLLDSVGQLMNYYAIADIVFVGGSLIKKGGHNILEPASLGKPVICGNHMFNFRDIADLFVNNGACILVKTPRELEKAVAKLLGNPSQREELGNKAKELVAQNRGATLRNLECIYAKLPI